MKYSKFLGAVLGAGLVSAVAFSADASMAKYKVVDGTIPMALTDKAGDPVNGRKQTMNRKTGNCLACHAIADMTDQPFHGEVGPALDDVGSRFSPAELRARLVDPKVINPDTIMPSFYKVQSHNVLKKWEGKTILSAQQVEDIIAYLTTLQGTSEKKLEVLDKPPVE